MLVFSLVTGFTHTVLAFHWPWFTLTQCLFSIGPTLRIVCFPVIFLLILTMAGYTSRQHPPVNHCSRWYITNSNQVYSAERFILCFTLFLPHTHTHTHTHIYIYPPHKKKKTAKPNAKVIFGMEHSRIRWHYKYKERQKNFINMWIYKKKLNNC